MDLNSSASQRTDPYQHWLDDAANMGLMLFRMRNDSKRERMTTPSGQPPPQLQRQHSQRREHRASPPRPLTPMGSPHHHGSSIPQPLAFPESPQQARMVPPPPPPPRMHEPPPMPPYDATPRTSRALQTPTVATQSSRDSLPPQPGAFYLPLD